MSINPEPDPDHIRTLFVLFPRKFKNKEDVMKLHPGIEAVKFSRRRAGRWCHIRFETEELAKQARTALHKKKVPHGRLIVSETRKKKIMEEKSRKAVFNILYLSHIPNSVTKEDLKSTFKTCKKVHIKPTRSRQQFNAMLVFRSHAEAQELLDDKESHKVNGIPITIKFPTSFYNYIQNAQDSSEDFNMDELDDIRTDEAEDNSEDDSDHVMQKYSAEEAISEASLRERRRKEIENSYLKGPALQDISDDDDMQGSAGQKSV